MASSPQRIGLTPGKAALMAALTIGLFVVWGPALKSIFAGKSGGRSAVTPQLAAAKPASARRTPSTATRKAPVVSSGALAKERLRPEITIAEASAYDPFAPPAWTPSARQVAGVAGQQTVEPSELESRFGTLRQTGIAMILVSGDGRAAQVGDRTLRVGDTIDGFEVVEINAEGVTFKPAPPDSEGDARGA